MKRRGLSVALFYLLTQSLAAQTSPLISLSGEPHHHLMIHSEYVDAYQVELHSHDATVLHRHDYDYAQLGIGNAQLVGVVPGQPDSTRKIVDGEVQFAPKGACTSRATTATLSTAPLRLSSSCRKAVRGMAASPSSRACL